ncbi:bacterioferritin [Teredinibacter purpureus]|jgi:bacterioferritin|uniref:bacterioferritin n=1 Tax=Teredinibacter purpureus TaxID=2731756 RepID=UPI0005F81B2A|nr:bacterioferritin [Teredinibacter purpureus]
MQSSPLIISTLNDVLATELTSINHYFLHARMYKNWGFENLNHVSFKKSIKDMKQADELIERILMLDGLPNLQKLNPLQIGEHTEEMLGCDLSFQQHAIAQLKAAIATCEQEQDYVSRSMLDELLESEETYLDWIETQQHLVSTTGIQNYLQSQLSEGE